MQDRDGVRIKNFWSAPIRGAEDSDPLLTADNHFLLHSDPQIAGVWSDPIRSVIRSEKKAYYNLKKGVLIQHSFT